MWEVYDSNDRQLRIIRVFKNITVIYELRKLIINLQHAQYKCEIVKIPTEFHNLINSNKKGTLYTNYVVRHKVIYTIPKFIKSLLNNKQLNLPSIETAYPLYGPKLELITHY